MGDRAPTTTRFFAITLAFTWILQLPGALASMGIIAGGPQRFMPLMGLGAFGPTVAAIVCARREGAGRALWDSIRRVRFSPRWFVVALALYPLCWLVGIVVYRGLGFTDAAWVYPPDSADHVVALFLFPIVEEIGWRGYALPRLLPRHGAVRASIIVGVVWGVWHLMMFLAVTTDPVLFAVSIVNIVAGSFLFTWAFARTGGSTLIAIVVHMGTHLNNPSRAETTTALVVYTAGIVVVTAAAMVLDRRAWSPPFPSGSRPEPAGA